MYNTGWKIHIVDEFPKSIVDMKEQPYVYEQWLETQAMQNEMSSSGIVSTILVIAISLFLLWTVNIWSLLFPSCILLPISLQVFSLSTLFFELTIVSYICKYKSISTPQAQQLPLLQIHLPPTESIPFQRVLSVFWSFSMDKTILRKAGGTFIYNLLSVIQRGLSVTTSVTLKWVLH